MTRNNSFQALVLGSYIGVVALWLFLMLTGRTTGDLNYAYSFVFGLIPLLAGITGMFKSRLWGGLRSTMGKAIMSISFGLLLWGIGETIWSYYNFILNVPAPYPSLADLGFAPSILFWIIGTLYLAKATGALFALKKTHAAKVVVFIVPVVLLIASYFLQVKLARGGVIVPEGETVLKTVLDIVYPFGDFVALTFAALVFGLSYKYFGGLYRGAVTCLLAGLALMYIGDVAFSYTTTEGTYYNGNWSDLLLASGLALMSYGILAFATKPTAGTKGNTE